MDARGLSFDFLQPEFIGLETLRVVGLVRRVLSEIRKHFRRKRSIGSPSVNMLRPLLCVRVARASGCS